MLYYEVIALIFLMCGTRTENSITISKGSTEHIETTEVPITSATNFTYTFVEKVLNISFAPTFIGEDYQVDLTKKGESLASISKILHDVKPIQYHVFDTEDVVVNENYRIEIYDIFEVSVRFTSELLCLIAYKTAFLDCNICQFGIGFKEDIREQSITPYFTLPPKYAPCFHAYTFELGVLIKNSHGKNLCLKNVTLSKNVTYSDNINATFNNLPPNHYCVCITGHHEFCPINAICNLGCNMDGKKLKEYKEDKPPSIKKKKHDDNTLMASIVPSCVVVIIIIILVSKRKKLVEAYFPTYQLSNVRPPVAKASSVDGSKHKKKLIVPILYAQDIEGQIKVTDALDKFLKECCNVDSVIGENNPYVLMGSAAWYKNNYRLSGNDKTPDKIIILETDAAVRWYQYWVNLGKVRKPQYRQYSNLEDMFISGFSNLASSSEFLETNHSHIVVIRFSYFLNSNQIDCFKQKRLYLPEHLVELYNSLWDEKDLKNEEENLLNTWKEKASYNELLRTITEMKKFVEENQDYSDKYVFTDTKVLTV